MTDDACAEMRLLVQADVDGELTPAETARVAAHLEHCHACATLQAQLIALSKRFREEATTFAPPGDLLTKVRSRIALTAPPATTTPAAPAASVTRPSRWRVRQLATAFGGGFALAACLAQLFLLPHNFDAGTLNLADAVVSDHIRALQPGHLMDVVSTDQHTVKPWFNGRLDFAPPVKDLKDDGFPLAGGRLDYLDGRTVAALIYQRRKHTIDLYIWPDDDRAARGPSDGSRGGYNFVRWHQNGMTFWAVSDLAADELDDFARLIQAG